MGLFARIDHVVRNILAVARWLVLPVALILFLQWPLRDFVRWGSREANDLGQWIFALYVSAAVTFATREGAHLVVLALVVALPGLAHLAQPHGHDASPVETKRDDDAARKRFNDMIRIPAPE
jgi:hypothetical protein